LKGFFFIRTGRDDKEIDDCQDSDRRRSKRKRGREHEVGRRDERERTEEICVPHPLDGFVDVGDSSQRNFGVHRVDHTSDEPKIREGRLVSEVDGREVEVGTNFDSMGCCGRKRESQGCFHSD